MTHDGDVAALLAHLRTDAHRYLDGVRPRQLQVELLTARRHRFSKTYRFRIAGENVERQVFAKVMSVSNAGSVALEHERPRLASIHDWVNIRPRFEYQALRAVFEHFDRVADPRLGAVQPLEYLEGRRAIVMEVIQQPTLRELLWKATRFTAPINGVDLDIVFRHAGAWLREFHQVRVDGHHPSTLRARRGDVLDALTVYTDFLATGLPATRFFEDAVSTATARAPAILPATLPLGLGHGDFAPRNIFVSPERRVTVIDMLGRWRVPIYEDIAYLLTALRTAGPQRVTHGLAFHPDRLARYENEFLAGYFDRERIPHGAIALFNLLLVLDRWSSFANRTDRATVVRRARKAASQAISNRYLFHEAERLVGAIADART